MAKKAAHRVPRRKKDLIRSFILEQWKDFVTVADRYQWPLETARWNELVFCIINHCGEPQEFEELTRHTVRYGDRVWYLANDYGYKNRQRFTDDVRDLNPGIDFNRLKSGQVIRVPTKAGVSVKPGTPYTLRNRQAMRSRFGGIAPRGTHPSTLRILDRQLRKSFGPTSAPVTAPPQSRQLRQHLERQLGRRPSGGTTVAGAHPSTLRMLGQHLKKSFGTPSMTARSRQSQQRMQLAQRQLNRRPIGGVPAYGPHPSTLRALGQHLMRG